MNGRILYVLCTACVLFPIPSSCQQDSMYCIGAFYGKKSGTPSCMIKNVGDVTGDGRPDYMIAWNYEFYSYLYCGGATLDTIPKMRFKGFGFSGLGDVNGDGYNDFCTGGWWVDYLARYCIYYGGPTLDTIPEVVFLMESFPPGGMRIGNVGDLNGDNRAEYMLSFPIDSGLVGRAYLYLGSTVNDSIPELTFTGRARYDIFGKCFCGIHDINNDGYNDLAISAPSMGPESSFVYFYLGGSQISTTPYKILSGLPGFGWDIVDGGDINCDGKNELLIFGNPDGRTIVYSGLDSLLALRGGAFGTSGDVNGDGVPDVLFGDIVRRNKDSSMVGCVEGYYGSAHFDTIPDFTLWGEHTWDHFGETVSILGDINGDGFVEFAVTAPQWPDYNAPIGKISIYSKKKLNAVRHQESLDNTVRSLSLGNYPNPFNSRTTITFDLPTAGTIHLEVYSLEGRKIADVCNGRFEQGLHRCSYDAAGLASGVYFYRLTTPAGIVQRPMLLIK